MSSPTSETTPAAMDRRSLGLQAVLQRGVHQALLKWPDAWPLLRDAGHELSYGDCRQWVSTAREQLLADCGGQAVAIWMDKQALYAQCILATLFSGARYLPLDGAQPVERVQAIVADARPALLILDAAHAELWLQAQAQRRDPDTRPTRLLVLSEQTPALEAWADAWAEAQGRWLSPKLTGLPPGPALQEERIDPGAVAAILYTSGSTGLPKGVQLSQLNVLNFVSWAAQTLGLQHEDRLLNLASFNFDLSTFDLFAALQAGASVYISHESELRHMARLGELLEQQAATVVYGVPSTFGLLLRSGVLTPERQSALRHLIFAGEVMPKPLLQALAAQLPRVCRLYNFYGPTETNVCLWHPVSAEDLASDGPVPIGRPIRGAEVWLQDESGRHIVEEGHQGEIWVAGDCVTPGYWQRPDDANSQQHRLGRHATGDQGSWHRGSLLYHGRRDRMVKIHGFRVELGEIEAALARQSQLAECAVLALPGASGTRLLAAYVPREGCCVPGTLALKQHCASLLPAYMVPQQWVALAQLPKNANGKIDLRRLQALILDEEAAQS